MTIDDVFDNATDRHVATVLADAVPGVTAVQVASHPAGPVLRSHPSVALTLAALGVVTVGALLPATPLAPCTRFPAVAGGFFAALVGMVVCYLILIEVGKRIFYPAPTTPPARRPGSGHHHLLRSSATPDALPASDNTTTRPGLMARWGDDRSSTCLPQSHRGVATRNLGDGSLR